MTSPHVHVWHDGVRKPLQPPYDDPFKIIKHNSKYFTLNVGNSHDTVWLDRLKPAYLDTTFTSELDTSSNIPSMPTLVPSAAPYTVPHHLSPTPPRTLHSLTKQPHIQQYILVLDAKYNFLNVSCNRSTCSLEGERWCSSKADWPFY